MNTFQAGGESPLSVAWSSWDFYPSPWNGGNLIANCEDRPEASFNGFAAPGVSLCGESGFDTARWRRAEWDSLEDFLRHREPRRMDVLDLGGVLAELPEDFVPWATRASAEHIERLRSFALHRPGEEAEDLADLLQCEMEEIFPGALESLYADDAVPELGVVRHRDRGVRGRALVLRDRTVEHFPSLRMSRLKAMHLLGQALCFAFLYVTYRLIREPWAPRGTHVDPLRLYDVPIGELGIWLYGLGHIVIPLTFLSWVYFKREDVFPMVRNTIIIAFVITVGAYRTFSPGKVYADELAASIPSSALPTMPGMHLAVAVGLAYFGVRLARSSAVAVAWIAYPVLVVLVLALAGSRYPVLTVLFAAAALVASVFLATRVLPRLRIPGDIPRRWSRHQADRAARD